MMNILVTDETCRFYNFSELLFDYRIKFIFPEKKILFIFIFALLPKENNRNNNKKKETIKR